jgi:hypothetical protein
MTEMTAEDMAVRREEPGGLADQLGALRAEVDQLRADVVRLDADLDESRRLNLRAAELLDVVYEELGARRAAVEEAP